jgi:5-methylcytosine-specific restriction endonuclease McrA
MPSYSDSLRGYGHRIYQRDNFTCRYCGTDGRTSFEVWLTLSIDHLLPVGHPDREQDEFKITACRFCNEVDNQYFTKYGLIFDNKTPDELIEQRRPYVQAVRDKFKKFWEENVKPVLE